MNVQSCCRLQACLNQMLSPETMPYACFEERATEFHCVGQTQRGLYETCHLRCQNIWLLPACQLERRESTCNLQPVASKGLQRGLDQEALLDLLRSCSCSSHRYFSVMRYSASTASSLHDSVCSSCLIVFLRDVNYCIAANQASPCNIEAGPPAPPRPPVAAQRAYLSSFGVSEQAAWSSLAMVAYNAE